MKKTRMTTKYAEPKLAIEYKLCSFSWTPCHDGLCKLFHCLICNYCTGNHKATVHGTLLGSSFSQKIQDFLQSPECPVDQMICLICLACGLEGDDLCHPVISCVNRREPTAEAKFAIPRALLSPFAANARDLLLQSHCQWCKLPTFQAMRRLLRSKYGYENFLILRAFPDCLLKISRECALLHLRRFVQFSERARGQGQRRTISRF